MTQVVSDYSKDRRLCVSLAIGFSSLAAYTAYQTSQPAFVEQSRQATDARRAKKKRRGEDEAAIRAASANPPAKLAPAASELSEGTGETSGATPSSVATTSTAAAMASSAPSSSAAVRKKAPGRLSRSAAAVDATFVRRMAYILRIVVPSLTSKEAMLLAIQSVMLVSRSFISLRIARKGGDGLQAVMERSWKKFFFVLGDFWVSGVAASVVNSALKYLTNGITVSFRERLTAHVHQAYLSDRAYYRAAVLRIGNLDNADQRIAEDLNQFCATASDLFARTFKPLLDVVLSTARMSENMGFSGLAILYAYFFASGAIIRSVSPPFSEYIAKTQKLEGDFRRSHGRLIQHAEEVAFLDGAEREREILDEKLNTTCAWSRFYFYLQFKQGVVDQYFVKYFASMIGWPVLAFPFLADATERTGPELAARYRESDTLIQSASTSIGDLMMVYKKLQRLAGFTARVVELLEAVEADKDETERRRLKSGSPASSDTGSPASASAPPEKRNAIASRRPGGVRFRNVTVYSPDGRLLVKDVDFDLAPGENLFVTGANGAGKTSLFRVLAGLWAPASGAVEKPGEDPSPVSVEGSPRVFYVPQRPYLVSGTLRDQVTYPLPGAKAHDARVLEALSMVNLLKLAEGDLGLDRAPHDWTDVLSGGEKQRVGLARLYFHRPRYAVLDEATAAINPDEEGVFYAQLGKLGITAFSIAHRPELRKFHHKHLHFHADGTGGWTLKDIKDTAR